MIAPLATVGQVVAVFSDGEPVSITKVSKVRTRLGKVTSFETANGRKWNANGYAPGPLARGHVEVATLEHAAKIKRRRIASELAAVRESTWRLVPLDVLKATLSAVETAREAEKERER